MENKYDIDWLNTVSEDDLAEVIEPLSGVGVLLDGLHRTHDDGFSKATKDAYQALRIVINHVEKQLEDFKPKIEYMDSKMREVNKLDSTTIDMNVGAAKI